MSHLPAPQYHWTKIALDDYLKYEAMAEEMGLKLVILLVTAITERLGRRKQDKGREVSMPTQGHVWTVPGSLLRRMFNERFIKKGKQHFWILKVDKRFALAREPQPGGSRMQVLGDGWHKIIDVPAQLREEPSHVRVLATTTAGNKLKVDLTAGKLHVTVTLEFDISV
jgi:hypothetical protein